MTMYVYCIFINFLSALENFKLQKKILFMVNFDQIQKYLANYSISVNF